MALTLPYQFDNTKNARIITMAMLAEAIFMPVILYVVISLAGQDDATLMGMLPVLMAMVFFMGIGGAVFIHRLLSPVRGQIDRHMVTIVPERFMGLPNSAPAGTFALSHFKALHVVPMKNGAQLKLLGQSPRDNFTFASGQRTAMQQLATDLGQALGLPVEA